MKDYFLPKIKELHINNYDLFKCPFDVNFSEKINLVFGTNGIGKTTFLNIIQYSIIGPYIGKIQSRNWKNKQKLRRPTLDKYYFRNRMTNKSESSKVQVVFYLGNDKYEVEHSLYDHKLNKVIINDMEIYGDIVTYETYEKKYFGNDDNERGMYLIDKYHKQLENSSCFPDINSFILIITEIVFFGESRELAFWNQDMTKSILSKLMPTEKYFEYDSVQKLIKKYDSQERLVSYKMSMIKEFLGSDLDSDYKKDNKYSLTDFQNIKADLEKKNNRINRYEQDLNRVHKEINRNRLEFEKIGIEILNIEQKWYDNIFPDRYQHSYEKYSPSILDGTCPFCGKKHIKNRYIEIDKCFYCSSDIEIKQKIDINKLEIKRINLNNKKNIIDNNYSLLKKEVIEIKKNITDEKKELIELIDKKQEIENNLDLSNNDNLIKYKKLELEKNEYHKMLEEKKNRERELASEIDRYVLEKFKDYRKTFMKYAISFLGDNNKVDLQLVGETDESLLRFILNGSERESEDSLSESQRIFVDMAYRFSILEFFHKDSYYISETPDSTLDYFFESNAVNTFSYFIDSGNTLFLSANARNSGLIDLLLESYKNECVIINLINISNVAQNELEDITNLKLYKFLEN